MKGYNNKEELIDEIKKTAFLFIKEFDEVKEEEKNKLIESVDRTPSQMIAYQLGWMNLLLIWEYDELNSKENPTHNFKWNKLGELYDDFYCQYSKYSLNELKELFSKTVIKILDWIIQLSHEEVFEQDIRKWASLTPSKWAIWKWVHINTVAPFKTFRTKIRKWKKLNLQSLYFQ